MSDKLISGLTFGQELGRGNFGVVYKGIDPIHGDVAIKVFFRQEDMSDAVWNDVKQRALEEGQRLKDAEHDRVARVFYLAEPEDKEEVWLIMDYYPDGCLRDHSKRGPMPLNVVRQYLTDTALGLQVLHDRGMIHRDIKPSNILIDHTGKARLADFGLVTNNIIQGYASAEGYMPHWAPEVLNDHVTSIRTDVWALGLSAYRLLHGETYFRQQWGRGFKLIDATASGGIAQRLKWLPHVPASWQRFVRKALHDDPNQRYQNARELLNGLERMPIIPSWTCHCTPKKVVWERTKNDRHIVVQWTTLSDRKHEWIAQSHPLGTGRVVRLGGSGGIVSKQTALRQMKNFFSSQRG
jgi:eukaryotic-like serine/threonine-protein kinase